MIFEKKISVPAYGRRRVRLSGRTLQGGEGLSVSLTGLKAKGEELVVGEGAEEVCVAPALSRLYATAKGTIFAHGGNKLYKLQNGTLVEVASMAAPPNEIAEYQPVTGAERTFAITDTNAYLLTGTGVTSVSYLTAGSTIAYHRERLFTAKGERVSFTRALEPESTGTGVQDGGYLDLPSAGGAILRLVPFDDRLVVLRERGISSLRAFGDNMDFVAKEIAFTGKIAASSAAVREKELCFLTERDLCVFDGDRIKRVPVPEADCSAGGMGGSEGENYVCAVTLKTGERAILVYDGSAAHLLALRAEQLAGRGNVVFTAGGKLCRLKKQCALGREIAVFETGFTSLYSAREKLLSAFAFEGAGRAEIRLKSDRGTIVSVFGSAGELVKLPAPLKGGAFSVRITTSSSAFRLSALQFELREERKTW